MSTTDDRPRIGEKTLSKTVLAVLMSDGIPEARAHVAVSMIRAKVAKAYHLDDLGGDAA